MPTTASLLECADMHCTNPSTSLLTLTDTKAKHICFAGPKGELPKGTDGSYGTSILLSYAMDPANDVLIAYKQNGRWLTPDHGFPVRTIIPGEGHAMLLWHGLSLTLS